MTNEPISPMDITAFVSAFKTEIRKHGDIFHTEMVDNAIRAGVKAGVEALEASAPTEPVPALAATPSEAMVEAPAEFEE